MKIFQWNARSLWQRRDSIPNFINEHNIDVLLIEETWLKPKQIYHIKDFNTARMDRNINTTGGRVACFVRDDIYYDRVNTLNLPDKLEYISLKIEAKNETYYIVNVYRPPDPAASLTRVQWKDTIRKLQQLRNLIMYGDLNAQSWTWSSTIPNQQGLLL